MLVPEHFLPHLFVIEGDVKLIVGLDRRQGQSRPIEHHGNIQVRVLDFIRPDLKLDPMLHTAVGNDKIGQPALQPFPVKPGRWDKGVEFVAGDAADQALFRKLGPKEVRDALKNVISESGTEDVVNDLKAVHVGIQKQKTLAGILRHQVGDAAEQIVAGIKAGQAVVGRFKKLLTKLLLFGGVVPHTQKGAHRMTVKIVYRVTLQEI